MEQVIGHLCIVRLCTCCQSSCHHNNLCRLHCQYRTPSSAQNGRHAPYHPLVQYTGIQKVRNMGPVQILGALLCMDAGICQSNNIKQSAKVSSNFTHTGKIKLILLNTSTSVIPRNFLGYRQPHHDMKVFQHLVLTNHQHTLKTGT